MPRHFRGVVVKQLYFNEKKEKQKYENNPLSRNTRFLFAKTNHMKSTLVHLRTFYNHITKHQNAKLIYA